jgi:hypothetical protein
MAFLLATHSPAKDETRDKIGIVADTLRLTDPGDYVLDSKGETIYRRRPAFLLLEGVTARGLRMGLLANNLQERLIATQTPLVTLMRMPRETSIFIQENYLPIAFRLLVLGKWLYAGPPESRPPRVEFDVTIPGRYRIVAEHGPFEGTLNGAPLVKSQTLAAGHYTLEATGGTGRVALVWAQALERGYSPFAPIKPDNRTPED